MTQGEILLDTLPVDGNSLGAVSYSAVMGRGFFDVKVGVKGTLCLEILVELTAERTEFTSWRARLEYKSFHCNASRLQHTATAGTQLAIGVGFVRI